MIILFADSWNPFCRPLVRFFESLKQQGREDAFVVDMSANYNIAAGLGVVATPSIVVMAKGKPVKIKRRGWEEDYKCKL